MKHFGRDSQIPLIQSMQTITHIHTRELEPTHSPPSQDTLAYTLPPTHTQATSPPSLLDLLSYLSLTGLPLFLLGPHVLLGTGSTRLHCQLWCELS